MRQYIYKIAFIYAIIFIFEFHFAIAQNISLECPELKIIKREKWGSVNNISKAEKIVNPHVQVIIVVIHNTATNNCTTADECKNITKEIEKYDLEILRRSDITMHFFIGGEDMVFEGRGWGVLDEGIPGYPFAFNIAFIGNDTSETINTKALYAAQNIIQCGVKMKKISKDHKVYGHTDLRCTYCPGEKLYKMIKKWPSFNRDSTIFKEPCPNKTVAIVTKGP